MISVPNPRFRLGQVVATPGAVQALEESGESPWEFLRRHLSGDWGELDEEDRRANEEAIKEVARILSAYRTSKGKRLWVITEADRSSTCILLPDDY